MDNQQVITDDWRTWIAENLLRQVDRDAIIYMLVRNGITEDAAISEVNEATRHPYVIAGRLLARKLQKRDWLLEVYRRLDAESPARTVQRRTTGCGFFQLTKFALNPLEKRAFIASCFG